jgi:hypothetical protein
MARRTSQRQLTVRLSHISAAPGANSHGRRMLGWVADAGLLLLLVLALPLVVLVIGTPVALVVRLLVELARRWL